MAIYRVDRNEIYISTNVYMLELQNIFTALRLQKLMLINASCQTKQQLQQQPVLFNAALIIWKVYLIIY